LFKNQTEWQDLSDPLDKFAQYAVQIEVPNIDQFKSDITNKKHIDKVQKNNNEALGLSLPGTPSLFFNGHQLKNADIDGLLKQAEEFYIK
jgi:protein-disulfide isomerase